jgi:hypothetical protein
LTQRFVAKRGQGCNGAADHAIAVRPDMAFDFHAVPSGMCLASPKLRGRQDAAAKTDGAGAGMKACRATLRVLDAAVTGPSLLMTDKA